MPANSHLEPLNSNTSDEYDSCLSPTGKPTFPGDVLKPKPAMSEIYPKYFKSAGTMKEVDVYAVRQLFSIQDPSGAIQHVSKKLLLSGVRTGGKSKF